MDSRYLVMNLCGLIFKNKRGDNGEAGDNDSPQTYTVILCVGMSFGEKVRDEVQWIFKKAFHDRFFLLFK